MTGDERRNENRKALDDLNRLLREYMRRAKEITDSIGVVVAKIGLDEKILYDFEFRGKLVSGGYEDSDYVEPVNAVSNSQDAVITLLARDERYTLASETLTRRKIIGELRSKLGREWTIDDFLRANVEVWPYDDRSMRFDEAYVVRAYTVKRDQIRRQEE